MRSRVPASARLAIMVLATACRGTTPVPISVGSAERIASTPALWGNLPAGPYAVSFSTIYQFDRSRTWRATRGYASPFAPDAVGRPIRISLWFPAIRDPRSRQLRFADYVLPAGPASHAAVNHLLAVREQIYAADRAPPGRWADVLALPVAAHADAPPAAGRFPLVLFAGALGDTSTTSVSVAAEYLASHGYVVATVPILGPSSDDTEQGRTPGDRERTVRDLEVAWSILRDHPSVDPARTGIFGHSLGGIEAVLFAMRNANVSAIAGLDGTYGFAGLGRQLAELPGYDPRRLRAAFLDLRRPDGDHGGIHDLAAEHGFHHADRTFVTIPDLRHRDFRAYAMVSYALTHDPASAAPYAGYQTVCRIVLDFFDDKLKADPTAAQRLRGEVASIEHSTFEHEDATPPLPSPDELVALIATDGFAAATAIVDRLRRDLPGDPILDEDRFADRSDQLLAEGRPQPAIELRRLVAYAHPGSAHAAEGLADVYLAAGQPGPAREALQRALGLIDGDPGLTGEQRHAMAEATRTRLDHLR